MGCRGAGPFALAGALFGLAALCRSMPIYFVAAVAVAAVLRDWRGAGPREALALVGGFAALTLPYSVALSIHLGEPTLIENHGGAWVRLYIERWLKAPAMLDSGELVARTQGTPQGGVISPLLANLFLHYAFDRWMGRAMPGTPFERYADDIICHCRSEREAQALRRMIEDRFIACGLMLHPQKTKIVYCKDTSRTGQHANVTFDFLGYTFQPRRAKWPSGLYRVSYLPAAGPSALKGIRRAVRDWSLQRRSDKGLLDLARMFSPDIRGWIGYYSHFYKSALYPTLRRIDAHLLQWAARKYKRFRRRPQRARAWLARVVRRSPNLFAHWKLLYGQGRMLGAV